MGGELSLKLPFSLIHVDKPYHGVDNIEYDILTGDKSNQKIIVDDNNKPPQIPDHNKITQTKKYDLKLDNVDSTIRNMDQICTDFSTSMVITPTAGTTLITTTTTLGITSLSTHKLLSTPTTITTASITSPSPSLLPLSTIDNSNYDKDLNNQIQKSNQSMLLSSSVIDKIEPITSTDKTKLSESRFGRRDECNISRIDNADGGGSGGIISNKSHKLLRNLRHDTIELTSVDVEDRDFDEDIILGTTADAILNSPDDNERRKNSETTCVEVHATSS